MWRALLLAICGVGWLLAGGAFAQEVKIGVLTHLSGPLAGIGGSDLVLGVQAAAREIRAIAQRPIQVVVVDSGPTPDQALVAAERLFRVDKVDAAIGGPTVMTADAVRLESERAQAIGFTVGVLPRPKDANYVFNLGDTIDDLAIRAVSYARDNLPQPLPRVNFTDSPLYAQALDRAAKEGNVSLLSPKEARGRAIVFALEKTALQIAELHLEPESIVIGGPVLLRPVDFEREFAGLKQLEADGIKLLAVDLRDPKLTGETRIPTESAHSKLFAYGFAAVQLYVDAASRANTTKPEAIAEQLRRDQFVTAIGPSKFLSDGQRYQPSLGVFSVSAQYASYAPTSSGGSGTCKGGGCPCQDQSCDTQCCPAQ